jgi:hypothetical protein
MSETGGSKPAVADNRWATTAPPNPITEPLGAKKDVGYATNEIPTAAEWNWLLWINGIVDNWMSAAHIREFEDISEAVAATSPADVFRVGQPAAGNRPLGTQVYSLVPTGFTGVNDAASDGERAYYIDATAGVYAANVDTGAQVWAQTYVASTPNAIAADGRAVYIAGDAAVPGLKQINRDTGVNFGSTVGGTPQSAADIAANGSYACIVGGGGYLNDLFYYDVTLTPNQETGTSAHGNPLNACALDESKVYWGGIQGGGVDVRANILSSRASAWTAVLDPGSAPIVRCIETDGSLVYVGTSRFALVAGGNANFFVLSAETGALVASYDVQAFGTDDVDRIAIDGKNIFCTLQTGTTPVYVVGFTLEPLPHVFGIYTNIIEAFEADGVGLVSANSTTSVERHYMQTHPVTFERVLGTDVNRHPFHKLAIPIR